MRWLLALGFLVSPSRPAEACVTVGNPQFTPGEVSETNPPGTVEIVAVKVFRNDEPENSSCKDSTLLQIDVAATDNSTPATELGYRLRVVTGTTPLPGFGDRDPDRLGGRLLVFFSGAYSDLDFELGISAIDRSGNVGPETIVPIFDKAPPEGCNSGGSWSLLPGLALLALRRRRRSHWC